MALNSESQHFNNSIIVGSASLAKREGRSGISL